jgi:hypothetical protein
MKWYNKLDEPILNQPIIIYTINNNFMVVKQPLSCSWHWLLNKHKVKNWIYCDEVKPLNT